MYCGMNDNECIGFIRLQQVCDFAFMADNLPTRQPKSMISPIKPPLPDLPPQNPIVSNKDALLDFDDPQPLLDFDDPQTEDLPDFPLPPPQLSASTKETDISEVISSPFTAKTW